MRNGILRVLCFCLLLLLIKIEEKRGGERKD